MPRRNGIRVVILLGLVLAAVVAGPASAQSLVRPFAGAYTVHDLGTPPGVPERLGGLTLKAGTYDRLLIGGFANDATGALYEIGVVRDGAGHIVGFSRPATRVADAAYNDGGVTHGPGGVLFLARWPQNELGQIRPGSAVTDKVIPLTPLGIESSLASLLFVPPGQPGAGSLKLASYRGGAWYDADVVADGAGTYDLANAREILDSRIVGGPEGFVYVPSGSPQFGNPSLLVSEYGVDEIAAYQVNASGDPVIASRRAFITGLDGAEGALLDPVTGDYLFSTFGGGSRVIVVRGFRAPPPQLPPPQAGKTVNAFTVRGKVRIKLRGSRKFVELGPGQQIPVGSVVDTTEGRVTIVAAGNQTADFYDGVFRLSQTSAATPLTTLTLVEKLRCPRAGRASMAAKRKKSRKLWGERQRQLQDPGQAQCGDRRRDAMAGPGQVQEHADPCRQRRRLGARLRQAQDGAGPGGQEVRRQGAPTLANLAKAWYRHRMAHVGMHEAKTKLSQLVKRAEAGEEIVIARNGKPVARLVPVTRPNSFAEIRGIWRGQIHIADDFDELPDDIAEAFGAR